MKSVGICVSHCLHGLWFIVRGVKVYLGGSRAKKGFSNGHEKFVGTAESYR